MSSQRPVFARHHNARESQRNIKHDRDLPASSCSRFVTSYHLISEWHGTLRSTRGTVATHASSAMGHETQLSDPSVRRRTSFPRAPRPRDRCAAVPRLRRPPALRAPSRCTAASADLACVPVHVDSNMVHGWPPLQLLTAFCCVGHLATTSWWPAASSHLSATK